MSETQKHTKPNVPNLRFPGFEEEWKECRNEDLGKVITGNTPPTAETRYYENGYKLWASPADLCGDKYISRTQTRLTEEGFSKTRVVPQGTTLVTCIGSTIGKMGMASQEMSTNQQINSVIPYESTDGQFLYYAIQSQFPRYVKSIAVQAVPIISKGSFEKLTNYRPNIDEQRRIGSFLDLLDRRITIQNKVIKKYESLIKALRRHIYSTIESEKEVTIADVLSYEQPTKYIISNTDYSDNQDLTPVLTANKAFILGYSEEIEGVYDKGPCIILDDFTLDSKIVDFPFKVKSSAIKILSAKTSVCLRYIYEYLKFLDLNTEEHKRHYISEIEPMTIELPEEGTIQFIASLFGRMDQRRKGLERDLQLLKSQKDYLLRAMFI